MTELQYWLWLSSAEVSRKAKITVVKHFGSAEKAFLSRPGSFSGVKGISPREAEKLERRDEARAAEVERLCVRDNIGVLTLADRRYPRLLRAIPDPPVVLYIKGRLPSFDRHPPIAIVGTRSATEYGKDMALRMGEEIIACGGMIVSGLTAGIDESAASAGLTERRRLIGVLGKPIPAHTHGIEDVAATYGALISEYCPGYPVRRGNFRERNRITAGLSLGVLVVEAPAESGALLFAADAAELGKDIYALPGNADSEACVGSNGLLKKGARPVTCGWDIVGEYALQYPGTVERKQLFVPGTLKRIPQGTPAEIRRREKIVFAGNKPDFPTGTTVEQAIATLSGNELTVARALTLEGQHPDEITEKTGLTTSQVLVAMTMLEIKGVARHIPGNNFILNSEMFK